VAPRKLLSGCLLKCGIVCKQGEGGKIDKAGKEQQIIMKI
jgi:hypothetical protein